MIDREHELPITRQVKLLDISRGTVYYQPKPISPRDQALMNRIDRLHLELPFAGARMLRDLLRQEGHQVGRGKVSRLMKLMGIEALYRKPKTTQRHPAHRVYPYLLRNLAVTRPNQAWAMDITYIPMDRGFVYLAAVVDWYSRRVLSWKVSTTMDIHFCLEAVEEAMERHGKPEIMNTDQGSQFTSQAFTGLLMKNDIQISMDGKGAWRDNVFVERLWRSVKYEEVYLYAYDTVSSAKAGLDRYFRFYNSRRPHSSLDGQTPDQFYFEALPLPMAA
jgi:putative transposase